MSVFCNILIKSMNKCNSFFMRFAIHIPVHFLYCKLTVVVLSSSWHPEGRFSIYPPYTFQLETHIKLFSIKTLNLTLPQISKKQALVWNQCSWRINYLQLTKWKERHNPFIILRGLVRCNPFKSWQQSFNVFLLVGHFCSHF